MKTLFCLKIANILRKIFMVTILVATSATIFGEGQKPFYFASFNLSKFISSLKFLPKYTPSFCDELEINSDELKIGINPGLVLSLAKTVCKPALYVGIKYKVDKWSFDTIVSEHRKQFFHGFDKKVDDLEILILENTDMKKLSEAIKYTKFMERSSSCQQQFQTPEFMANKEIVNDFLSKIDGIFDMYTVTAKIMGVFLINVLMEKYLFELIFGKLNAYSMCRRISDSIWPDPYNIEVTRKEAEVTLAEVKADLKLSLSDDEKKKLPSSFFPSETEILRLKNELQQKIDQAAQKSDPVVPADLAWDWAINCELSDHFCNFLANHDLQFPEWTKGYVYCLVKELFIFWLISVDLKSKLHAWIMNNLDSFVCNLYEITDTKKSNEFVKNRMANESFRAKLKNIFEEKFSYKRFLKKFVAELAIDCITIPFGHGAAATQEVNN